MHLQYIHPHKYVTLVLVPALRAGITLSVTKLMSFAFALNEINEFCTSFVLAKDKIASMFVCRGFIIYDFVSSMQENIIL